MCIRQKMSNFVNGRTSESVESEIIDVMRNKDYSLDTVNNYGDNLLHISAANGCYTVIKEILKKHGDDSRDINAQNDCGWTPLMQAIRNGNVETVKLLLANNGCSSPEQSTFQGISAIALSAAIGREMFEIVYNACPSALENSENDNISPLCIAAMKNDKDLFFRLLELGLKVSNADDYTLSMMSQSTVPEIVRLVESHRDRENYWIEDCSIYDCESLSDDEFDEPQMSSTLRGTENSLEQRMSDGSYDKSEIPSICVSPPDDGRKNSSSKDSATRMINFEKKFASSLISPRLEYTRDATLAMSPNLCFARHHYDNDGIGFAKETKNRSDDIMNEPKNSVVSNNGNKLYKFQMNRPPNLQISKDDDATKSRDKTGGTPVSPDETPRESCYDTPPRELALNISERKMAFLLKRFGLTRFVTIFLEQEVDLDLFLSLNDQDLQEIGIANKSDRIILKSVIDECNRTKLFI